MSSLLQSHMYSVQKDIRNSKALKIHKQINQERLNCLLYRFCKDVMQSDGNIFPEVDVFSVIQAYYAENDELGKFLRYDEYFSKWMIPLDSNAERMESNWPQNMYHKPESVLRYDIIFIIVLLIVLIGCIIILIALYITNNIYNFRLVLIVGFCLVTILLSAALWQCALRTNNPIYPCHSLLVFNVDNNCIQEWRVQCYKMDKFGQLKWNQMKYFCKLMEVINIISFDDIVHIKLCQPWASKSYGLGRHVDAKRVIHHNGYIEFNGIATTIRYGTDCTLLLDRVKHIMGDIDPSYIDNITWV